MSIGLYMDEHVSRAITNGLRICGVDVLTAQEDQRNAVPDTELLDRSSELGRVLFTNDDDFLRIASFRQRQDIYFAGVIYVHQEDIHIGVCIYELETLAQAGSLHDFENRVTYLRAYSP